VKHGRILLPTYPAFNLRILFALYIMLGAYVSVGITDADYPLVARSDFTYCVGSTVYLCDPLRDFGPSSPKTLLQIALIHAREHIKTPLNASDFGHFIIMKNGSFVLIISNAILIFPIIWRNLQPLQFLNHDAFFFSNIT